MNNVVVLYKGGTEEKSVNINELEIPDIWDDVLSLEGGDRISQRDKKKMAARFLEVWYICHALKGNIIEAKP